MRIAVVTLVLMLLALSALASLGCRRAALDQPSPTLLVCHCSDAQDEAGASAIAAQVAFDMQPNNDDPNDLIAVVFADATIEAPSREFVAASPTAHAVGWTRLPLRPPRFAAA